MSTVDADAFQRIATALGQDQWIDCNEPGRSPCDLCTDRTLRFITCENVPKAATSGAGRRLLLQDTAGIEYERKITGITLKNVGMVGTFPVDAFTSLSGLKSLDLSSDPSLPYQNTVKLPTGDNCVNLAVCSSIPCDFGSTTPSCYTMGSPKSNYVTKPKQMSSEMIAAIVVPICIVVLFLTYIVWVCYPSWKHPKSKRSKHAKQQPQHGTVLLHDKAGTAPKRQVKFAEEEKDPEGPAATPPTLSRQKSMMKRAQSSGNLKALMAKAANLGVNIKTPTTNNAYRGDWVESVDANGNRYWTDRQTGQFSWRNPHVAASPQQQPSHGSGGGYYTSPPTNAGAYGGFGSQQPPMRQQQPPQYYAPPSPQRAPQYQQQQQQLVPGYNPWQEVYDPVNDNSYWINTATRQISYTPM